MSARVLVVDDVPVNRRLLEAKLSAEFFEVGLAASGAEALSMAALWSPDLILLDVMMPEMDGPTTFRHLQQDPVTHHIPVVLLTAKVLGGHTQLWDDLPVTGVISKPFDPTTLSLEIDRLLDARTRAVLPQLKDNPLSA